MAEQESKFPSEVIDLPSKGLLYDKTSPLSCGTIEMYYMRSREEDILTNQNFIEKGIVIDKLLQSLIVDRSIKYNDLLLGDKNALLLAARILGYGKDYEFLYKGEKQIVDLSLIESKPLQEDLFTEGTNEFKFTLPTSKVELTFKLLTHGDEKEIEEELKNLKKFNKESSPELSVRLKHMITAINGDVNPKLVRSFVDNGLLARDSREFRKYIQDIQPDVLMKFYPENGPEGGVDIPIGVTFLWPDAGL